jgi:hypothetical protein
MRFMEGQRVQVRLGESRRGANDGGWWEAEFIDYVGGDGCRGSPRKIALASMT